MLTVNEFSFTARGQYLLPHAPFLFNGRSSTGAG